VLTAVTMKSSIFWDITSCSPVKVNWPPACCRLHTGFLLGLTSDPEDGDMFLWNAGWLSMDCTVLHPKKQNSLLTFKFKMHDLSQQNLQGFIFALYWTNTFQVVSFMFPHARICISLLTLHTTMNQRQFIINKLRNEVNSKMFCIHHNLSPTPFINTLMDKCYTHWNKDPNYQYLPFW
jgi:hypothetical protein